jgi:hypothetical protein
MRLSVARALVIVMSAIVWLGTGAGPARAAEPIGPVCLGLETFIDSFELFLTPSGGQNFLLSGRNRNGGKPVFGSGRLNQGQFLFYFVTPALNNPGLVFEGTLNVATQLGTARCFVLDGQFPCATNEPIGLFPCP